MITEALLNVLFIPLEFLCGLLPDFSWTIEAESFTLLDELFRCACYLLPMGTVIIILTLQLAINIFKIVVAVIKFIRQMLPIP